MDGWLAGGPDGDKLYFTKDGGKSWKPKSVAAPSAASQTGQAHYALPEFQGSQDGVLMVTYSGQNVSVSTLYRTDDAGNTWQALTTLPLANAQNSGTQIAYAAVSPDMVLVSQPNNTGVTFIEKGKQRPNAGALKALSPDAQITKMDFQNSREGWLLVSSGQCAGFKTQCSQETKLFATVDAGQTLADVTPVYQMTSISEQPIKTALDDLFPPLGPGGSTRISDKKGFDKCAAATVSNMQTWWTSSPYYDANIYIGGSSRSCTQANLNASWVDQVSAMGWGLIPTWVGPQAPCSTFASRISSDPTTAQSQGVNEADNASNTAASLGLTQGTIIYYDLEHYDTNASCSAAVRAFLNGWVQRMHARGNLAGVYGSPSNAAGDWASIANPPDAVWIAKWDARETVWGLSPLSDSLWINHQRIHQYAGGHNETYGGITFNIDNDISDGPVAGVPSGGQSLPNLTPYQPSGWSDKLVISNTTGTSTDSSPLKTTDTIYVDWAVLNNGSAATSTTFYTKLFIDGVERTSWFTNPPLNVNNYTFVQDYSIGNLSAGTHTIKIVADATATTSESNESDNEYTRTITVALPGQPNLTPFQPSGWTGKIVVSNTTGTNTDSSPLKSTDTLYIDWAVLNNGSAATDATFYTRLLVDGVERTFWFTNPPLNVNFYASIQDYSIGSLSAGTHTIKIVGDYTGAISESNEADNEFTKTITVAAPQTCYTLTTGVSPGGGGTVTRNTAPNCSGTGLSLDQQAVPLRQEQEAAATNINSISNNARSAETNAAFRELTSKAEAGDKIRVIVGLSTAFQNEGNLSSVQAVQSQRSDINQAQQNVLSLLSGYDVQSVKLFPFIPYMAVQLDDAGLRQLEASSNVISIQEDVAVPPLLAESVALIGAPAAWASGYTGAGQTVAILDTGVDKTHPFLAGKVVSEACYSTNDARAISVCPGQVSQSTSSGSGVNCTVNGCHHGTHVAGIAAGKGASFSGVAKDASIIAIQVFSRFNSPADCGNSPAPCALSYNSDYILGLQRVQALSSSFNIAAANLSLGIGRYFSNCDASQTATKAAIDNLRSIGIASVIASGNDSYTDSMASPGCISTAVSVGSTDDGSSGTTADVISIFSPTQGSNSVSFLNLLAPGQWINSSIPGGGFANLPGTSMATPHVAGAWAVLKSKSPTATVDQVLSALTSTGVPVTDSRNGVTKPRIKVDAAVNALGGGSSGQYSQGTVVTLTAAPNAGYSFQSWSGCDSVSGNTCTVTMNAGRNVTANFSQITRTLTVSSSPSSGVSITASPNDNNGQGGGVTQFTRTYSNNTVVSLTAPQTAAGSNFQKWQRDGLDWSTNRSTSVTMDTNHTMTAVYAPTIQVTLQTNPSGRSFNVDGSSYSSTQIFSWASGSSHTISTTSPQSGGAGTQYVWSNWNDGGAISHTVAPTVNTTYTANFTSVISPPTATTVSATSVAATSATLNGSVNPNGTATNIWFEWGTSSNLATFNTTPLQAIGSGSTGTSVSANLSGLAQSTTYYFRVAGSNSGGTSKGAIFSFITSTASGETVWVDDRVPTGSTQAGSEPWTWSSTNPAPFSGALAHQSNIVSGLHNHYFYSATETLTVNAGEKLFTYVYIDPFNPVSELMLQWFDGTAWRNAYWGADNILVANRQYMGPLPATGQWTRLEVAASLLGLEGKTLSGMAFNAWNGRVTWDKAGKTTSVSRPGNFGQLTLGFNFLSPQWELSLAKPDHRGLCCEN